VVINGRIYKVDWPLKDMQFNKENCSVGTGARLISIVWSIWLRKMRKVKEIAISQSEHGGVKK